MESFNYIIEKINVANLSSHPFKHLSIESLFTEAHFQELISASQINLPKFKNDEELIDGLKKSGYEIIKFPGTTINEKKYLKWHKSRDSKKHSNSNTCEGFGITFRLKNINSPILTDLNAFLKSEKFIDALCDKFDIDRDTQIYDGGIQKYLDGYEISPHPDVRTKSLTWMINIHPMKVSESLDIHTDYLAFKDPYKYVQKFWEYNNDYDTCWIPWQWTDVISSQKKNNSLVMFSPSNDTLHAVKLNYDHLNGQRTQIYGNLWSTKEQALKKYNWEELIVKPPPNSLSSAVTGLKRKLKTWLK